MTTNRIVRTPSHPWSGLLRLMLTLLVTACAVTPLHADDRDDAGLVRTANLIYGENKTSVCFSDEFLVQIQRDTFIRTERRFSSVKLESGELFEFPFAVMSGEGSFTLSDVQRDNLNSYLTGGGFIVASAGCSSEKWNESIRNEIATIFPDRELTTLDADHPVFQMVYDVREVEYRNGDKKLPELEGLEIDGKVVLILSIDGLNDTANAGPNCCCCGGNEIRNAADVNVNLLSYALLY
ncbi:MAG: DUF4159 domain-containing protein [Phycisphaeraceae bacterium]